MSRYQGSRAEPYGEFVQFHSPAYSTEHITVALGTELWDVGEGEDLCRMTGDGIAKVRKQRY